ncbi:Arylsulfatase [Roseibaca ekhonensis]|jgi:N-sulfoglucosamine sulfohydrolase|uniref:Arylsulfatase n=1 Tax=Roseinatronobacter ekhonensis TaxID=254356 RepID=A0A3B0M9F6_9RHOB|nr:sulfatase [Roseibaca ekhonensis]SUZ32010.1 Arylsulfatase [Roseibaca ekhonensis]
MNILLMIADDLGRMAGCYGETAIRTPNIDALAARGTRFDMAFTSTASCSASRSVIYTGLHTHETGQYGLHHDHHHFMTFADVPTAPRLLAEAGYHTGIIGKVHVGPSEVYPWQHREESGTRDVGWVADRARAYFGDRAADRDPFFLTIGFVDPHRDETRGGFGNNAFGALDPVFPADAVHVPPFLPDLPEVRDELAAYYRSVHRLDRGVGLVLDALSAEGLADDTLVVFLSDNGAPFLNSKTTLFDAGVHLPLIMHRPGQKTGVANPNLVSFTDLLPTFLDVANAPATPGKRKGRSLLPILERADLLPDWQIVFGSHTFHEVTNYWPTRFLRTPRYKYHRNVAWQLDFPFSGDLYGSLSWQGIRRTDPVMIGQRPLRNYLRRPPEELYDLQTDPQEVRNLADAPEHADRLASFRQQMEAWQRDTRDPWLYRDGVSVMAVEHHLAHGLTLPDRFDLDPDNPRDR